MIGAPDGVWKIGSTLSVLDPAPPHLFPYILMAQSGRDPALELDLAAAARAFGRCKPPTPSFFEGSRHHHSLFLPVHIRPEQCQILARSKPGGESQGERSSVLCGEGMPEESPCLVWVHDSHPATGCELDRSWRPPNSTTLPQYQARRNFAHARNSVTACSCADTVFLQPDLASM